MSVDHATGSTSRRRPPNPRRGLLTCVALLVIAACTSEGSGVNGAEGPTSTTAATVTTVARKPVTHGFVIPAGTAEALARGEEPDIIPRRLDVHVGDRIRVRNDDRATAYLGLFDVAPGETVSMDFNKVTVLSGVIFDDEGGGCGSSPPEDKRFIINVQP